MRQYREERFRKPIEEVWVKPHFLWYDLPERVYRDVEPEPNAPGRIKGARGGRKVLVKHLKTLCTNVRKEFLMRTKNEARGIDAIIQQQPINKRDAGHEAALNRNYILSKDDIGLYSGTENYFQMRPLEECTCCFRKL